MTYRQTNIHTHTHTCRVEARYYILLDIPLCIYIKNRGSQILLRSSLAPRRNEKQPDPWTPTPPQTMVDVDDASDDIKNKSDRFGFHYNEKNAFFSSS